MCSKELNKYQNISNNVSQSSSNYAQIQFQNKYVAKENMRTISD